MFGTNWHCTVHNNPFAWQLQAFKFLCAMELELFLFQKTTNNQLCKSLIQHLLKVIIDMNAYTFISTEQETAIVKKIVILKM